MIDPRSRVREETRICFAELLAWLHDAIGEELAVELRLGGGLPALRYGGELEAGRELWRHPDAAVVFEIAGVELSLWQRQFESAWRLSLELPDGRAVRVIEVELRGGATLSLSRAPSD